MSATIPIYGFYTMSVEIQNEGKDLHWSIIPTMKNDKALRSITAFIATLYYLLCMAFHMHPSSEWI